MYWWNVKALAEDFREDRVDEKERFKYYLATTIVMSAVFGLLPYTGKQFTIANLAWDTISVATTILGTILCYSANRSGDNMDFIARMFCLGWPIGIKLAVLFGIVMLILTVLVFIFSALHGSVILSDLGWDIFGEVAGLGYVICYYWLTYRYVTVIARAKGD